MFSVWFAILFLIGVAGIAILVGSSVVAKVATRTRLQIKQRSRPVFTKEAFLYHFTDKNFALEITEFVYDKLAKTVPASFTMHPDDNLLKDYQLHHDFLQFLATETFRKVNKQSPDITQQKFLTDKNHVDTFEKILLFAEKKLSKNSFP
ncbi:MAG: hypothetical protein H7Y04_01755 [Verrucomicrobia bacterium]|nr:hypothetical protein [Cytophagales bacterium]